jgi:hypothetical protein
LTDEGVLQSVNDLLDALRTQATACGWVGQWELGVAVCVVKQPCKGVAVFAVKFKTVNEKARGFVWVQQSSRTDSICGQVNVGAFLQLGGLLRLTLLSAALLVYGLLILDCLCASLQAQHN